MTRVTREESFRLSRVYAKGWNAARSLGPARSNPFVSQPERDRWDEGYTGALEYYRGGQKLIPKRAAKAES